MKKAPDTLLQQDSSFQGTIIGRTHAGFISASEKQKQGKFLNIVQASGYKYRFLPGKLQYGEALGTYCHLQKLSFYLMLGLLYLYISPEAK